MLFIGSVNAQQVTVVTTENFRPYNYVEDDTIRGMATEVVRATLAKAGIEAEIRAYPRPRAYKMALEKKPCSFIRLRERQHEKSRFNG